MTNKEMYDAAVANGLEFTYFKGEDECPKEFKGTKKERFWLLERDCADRNASKNGDTCAAIYQYRKDLSDDGEEYEEDEVNQNNLKIPSFITNAQVSEAAKATAYECYDTLRFYSNGLGHIPDPKLDSFIKDTLSLPYNWNRGFDDYFNGK